MYNAEALFSTSRFVVKPDFLWYTVIKMNTKSSLSERDIITKYILPAIEASGWDKRSQIREEVSFTAGRIFVKGKLTKRGEKKRADIIIYYKSNIPVAVVEAKDNKHAVGAGMQQALEYASTLDIPVAISSNGDGFVIQYRRNCGGLDASGKAIIKDILKTLLIPKNAFL